MNADASVPQIIEDLYAGTLDQRAWDRAMVAMADLVRGSGTLLLGVDPSKAVIFRDEIHRFDTAAVAEYRKHWVAKDIRLEPGMRIHTGEPVFESKVLSRRQFQSSEIYNDYLLRVDSPSFFVFWLQKSPTRVTALSIQSSLHRGAFDEDDGQTIKPIIPHVRRVLEIKDRLERADVRRGNLQAALDKLTFGVLVLSSRGRILDANAAATELMTGDHGVRREADGTLSLSGAAGAHLSHWLMHGMAPDRTDGLLHVQRPLAQPLTVLVTRLPDEDKAWFGNSNPIWLLMLFDPERQFAGSMEVIERDLGLSAREAEVAALLASGFEISVVAQRLRISVHTARVHLKAIFAKTGVHSQAALIMRIRGGPAGVCSTI
jgi:DNA-binding CsgD family transcriptional regulator/PAS domain-containing protein